MIVLGVALVALLAPGCSESDQGSNHWWSSGSSSRSPTDATTVRGKNGEVLVLYKPSDVSLRRGDAEPITVRMRRENFDGDVKVSVANLPAGVEAVDAPRSTRGDSIRIVLRARDRADLVQNQEVRVSVEGPEGIRATESLSLTVRDRT
jgi:hypothetical protein